MYYYITFIPIIFQGLWNILEYPHLDVNIQSNNIKLMNKEMGYLDTKPMDFNSLNENHINFNIQEIDFIKNNEYRDYYTMIKLNHYIYLINKNKLNVDVQLLDNDSILLSLKYQNKIDKTLHLSSIKNN